MTVQDLFNLVNKSKLDPRKVEIFLAEEIAEAGATIKGEGIAEVTFGDHPEARRGWRGAYLVEEGAIHL